MENKTECVRDELLNIDQVRELIAVELPGSQLEFASAKKMMALSDRNRFAPYQKLAGERSQPLWRRSAVRNFVSSILARGTYDPQPARSRLRAPCSTGWGG